jgi:hypothetical protein
MSLSFKTTMLAPASCLLCSLFHFALLPGSLAPAELHVAGMPMRHSVSASFSPSTTAIVSRIDQQRASDFDTLTRKRQTSTLMSQFMLQQLMYRCEIDASRFETVDASDG